MPHTSRSAHARAKQVSRSNQRRFPILFTAVAASFAASAMAQEPEAAATTVEEITITGSRISTESGFTAPTPVSVVGAERIEQRAVTNIGDLLNELPAFRATQTPASQGLSGGYVGGRVLDLRGLGPVRTLVLLDSKRITPSTPQGTVDTNMIPSALVERVDVVTGGASAAYGSDAVAGVVNFILNENLTGFRSSLSYGEAEEGDSQTTAASLAGGSELFDGRGHWVAALEYEKNTGIGTCTERAWCAAEVLNFGRPTPTTPLPANNILPDVRPSTISPTGVINSNTVPGSPTGAVNIAGPLTGITFNPDGTPREFVYRIARQFAVHGEWRRPGAERVLRRHPDHVADEALHVLFARQVRCDGQHHRAPRCRLRLSQRQSRRRGVPKHRRHNAQHRARQSVHSDVSGSHARHPHHHGCERHHPLPDGPQLRRHRQPAARFDKQAVPGVRLPRRQDRHEQLEVGCALRLRPQPVRPGCAEPRHHGQRGQGIGCRDQRRGPDRVPRECGCEHGQRRCGVRAAEPVRQPDIAGGHRLHHRSVVAVDAHDREHARRQHPGRSVRHLGGPGFAGSGCGVSRRQDLRLGGPDFAAAAVGRLLHQQRAELSPARSR